MSVRTANYAKSEKMLSRVEAMSKAINLFIETNHWVPGASRVINFRNLRDQANISVIPIKNDPDLLKIVRDLERGGWVVTVGENYLKLTLPSLPEPSV
jgi:hypothetical protein